MNSALQDILAIFGYAIAITWPIAGFMTAGMTYAVTLNHFPHKLLSAYRMSTVVFAVFVMYGWLMLIIFAISVRYDPDLRSALSGVAWPGRKSYRKAVELSNKLAFENPEQATAAVAAE